MKIKDLKPRMDGATITARVVSVGGPRKASTTEMLITLATNISQL